MPNLKLRNGQLSQYGFACGYIEKVDCCSLSVQLWQEGSCRGYHIRCHSTHDGRIFWLSMPSIGIARKIYRKACKLVLNADTEALRQLANEYKQYA